MIPPSTDQVRVGSWTKLGGWIIRNSAGLLFLFVAIYGVVESLGWRSEVLLFPMVAACFLGAFSVAAAIQDTLRRRKNVLKEPTRTRQRIDLGDFRGLAWYVVTIVVVMLLGLQIGLPVAIAIMNRFALRATWLQTGLLTGVVVLVLWAFDSMFRVFWFEPLIVRLWPFA